MSAESWKLLVDLRGQWKFELGDNVRWAAAEFDDSRWKDVFAPSPWENEGYPGYDGYAWYRKHFSFPKDLKDKPLYLHLGCVDDVSEVYLNGHFLGYSGQFPPEYVTAYNTYQRYPLPKKYLNTDGDNVIAVRVYDKELEGGIVSGKLGIFEPSDYLEPDLDLSGDWKLKRGNQSDWDDPALDDSGWKTAYVPAQWETQGLKDYNGYAWYRLHFAVPEKLRNQDLVVVLGRIDDVDETYLNGRKIGRTGTSHVRGGEYLRFRAYPISPDELNIGRDNVLAVKVLDTFLQGGIYDGPIGIVNRARYRGWEKRHREKTDDNWNFFDFFFGDRGFDFEMDDSDDNL